MDNSSPALSRGFGLNSSMSFSFQRIAIVGFGLMGGSLAKALKTGPNPPHLLGVSDNPEELDFGMDHGLLDSTSGPTPVSFEDRDLVVYASPPKATLELLGAHADNLGGQTILTDMVSLKAPFLARAEALGLEGRCVGSHPMVGGTGSGIAFARDGLFQEARVWVTPGKAPEETIRKVEALWVGLGAHPTRIGAAPHDEMMAWVSHLPQIISNALALALDEAGYSPEYLGPGGRDMTRLAGSRAEMWRDILDEDQGALLRSISKVEETLSAIRALLATGKLDEVEALMRGTGKWLEKGE